MKHERGSRYLLQTRGLVLDVIWQQDDHAELPALPGSIVRLDLTNWRPTRDLRTWEAEGEELLQIKSALDKMALQEARKAGEDLGIHAFPVIERVNPNTGQRELEFPAQNSTKTTQHSGAAHTHEGQVEGQASLLLLTVIGTCLTTQGLAQSLQRPYLTSFLSFGPPTHTGPKTMASAEEMLMGEMKMFPEGLLYFRVRKRSTANRVLAKLSCSMVLKGRPDASWRTHRISVC
ncbi:hypothetical protein QTO34_018205 [Cnephaeus nilssonii]|uniref:Uncharacterized protein n=1 Tax=Cnephaeus nilssonii TaxID=3371016 RepID=A0AA40HZ46_CNENI|nr:hypothetical protein QTO34_018205 [Eptesicus nilssonii]